MAELFIIVIIVVIVWQGLRGKLKPGQPVRKFVAPVEEDDTLLEQNAALLAFQDFLQEDPETGRRLIGDLVVSNGDPIWIQFHAPLLFDTFEEHGFGKKIPADLMSSISMERNN